MQVCFVSASSRGILYEKLLLCAGGNNTLLKTVTIYALWAYPEFF